LRVVAALASVWVAWRWVGFVVGLGRLGRFRGRVKREARRTVLNRGALNVFFSIATVYLWAFALDLQLGETFVGFLAAMMMCSLAVGVALAFMQPRNRTPETLEVCRVLTRREASPASGDSAVSAEGLEDRNNRRTDDDDEQRREDARE
jgi:hypothetical protein